MSTQTLTYILHHNDPDGYGAACAAYQKFGDAAIYIPVDWVLPLPELEDGSDVYVLDFSFKRDYLDKLISRMNSVLIIDHHQSAQKDLAGHPNAIFDMNKSGAGLAWDFFVGAIRPDFINYIEDADLWRFALPNSHFIKNFIFNLTLTVENYLSVLNSTSLDEMIYQGKLIQKVIDHLWAITKPMVHVVEIDGGKMLALNSSVYYNEFGEFLLLMNEEEKLGCDFAGTYYRVDKDTIKFSLRSRRALADVSVVASAFGGGGHARSAGFEVSKDLFLNNRLSSKEIMLCQNIQLHMNSAAK